MADGPRFDLPTIEDEGRPFWDAAREGRLVIMRCNACGDAYMYPRPFCPKCWSDDVSWEDASGRGTVYTYSTVFMNDLPPFGSRLPYVAAAIDLEEGPRIMSNLVECDPADLRVGMAVEVTFTELTPEITAPVFRPAAH
ncbi:MAG: hypothetical protein JWL70_323 [Acidimicrobiia bacterium]|nr:hypothetical protein [Acidimicrobiia bacterium]